MPMTTAAARDARVLAVVRDFVATYHMPPQTPEIVERCRADANRTLRALWRLVADGKLTTQRAGHARTWQPVEAAHV